ncbi:hypothetical protein GGR58DRAFT_506777 [Xylaria digitata]|nr:hypothetical protein GGR58DRAFT_506777 [Xylaria digitata]
MADHLSTPTELEREMWLNYHQVLPTNQTRQTCLESYREDHEQAYAEIARRLDIQIKDDKDVKVSVRRYLESERAGRWLLIVDNADDTEIDP